VFAIAIVQLWPVKKLNKKYILCITSILSLMFIGNILIGNGPSTNFLPVPYEVSADSHSIEPEGIHAALWARSYLGNNNRIATDRVNTLLMATYGNQRPVTPAEDHVDITDVFFHMGGTHMMRRFYNKGMSTI
jgi:hypothetical protein